ncbi:MAG: benzoate-CoA ligase family protein [Armatimonadota bacterium]|nr:benzoate-CoA ligase family protein [Armatimonadota bacterium]MDR7445035.1 benzoate-CoA ligase family protein [Armatimonadota bacterium]MDR7570121.1 benzoate-CoA ligase family protein [Armatimonadota bacterium]MDR7614723.1 benzoate-CoA ligase family protein [Armatimonadota bacterium]
MGDTSGETFNLAEFLLDRHVREGRGDRPVLYFQDQTVSFRVLLERSNRLASALRRLGVEPENRVLLGLADRPEFYVAYFAALKIGAVPVLVSTLASPQDYAYFLRHSRAKVAVVEEAVAARLRCVDDPPPSLRYVVVVGEPGPSEVSWEDLLSGTVPEPGPACTSPDDMAFWMYSSGTTGRPKAVVHLHRDLLHFMPPHCREVVGLGPEDRVYSTSKLYFSYGRNNSLDGPFLYGAQVVLNPDRPEPGAVLDLLEAHRPTVFYSVPTFYAALLDHLHRTGRRVSLSFLRCCVSAGEPLPKSVFDRWWERFRVPIFDGVGSTEVGAIYLSNTPRKLRPGSSGVLLPGFEGKLLDEGGREVPRGSVGILWVKNDGIFAGYWNDSRRTRQALQGEWFVTGDLFSLDDDGFHWYMGRADDLLKPGGLWVSPLEVEGALLEHPAVAECAVVGAPDEMGLEKPMAFVVLRESYTPSPALERELRELVQARLARYKHPRWFRFVPELPRTVTGKLQRYRLREALRQERRRAS